MSEFSGTYEAGDIDPQWLAAILDSANLSIISTDTDGVIQWCNRGALDKLGYRAEEIIGCRTPMIIHDKDEVEAYAKELSRQLGRPVAPGIDVFTTSARLGLVDEKEWTYICKDGSRYPVGLSVTPLLDAGGELRGFLGIGRDISERKQYQACIEQQQKELSATNEELETLVYSLSHDLRAPLRHVSAYASILYDDYRDQLDDNARHYLQRIARAAGQMGELMEDMLQLFRVSHKDLVRTRVDLSAIAERIVEELRNSEPDRQVEVDIGTDMVVDADAASMKLALENLLRNAWKFTGKTKSARISFSMSKRRGQTILCIKDNGPGFDEKDAEGLFTPFHRLHPESEFEGTGIGLSIVKRIIEKHNGNVYASGARGEGASFYLMLPSNAAIEK